MLEFQKQILSDIVEEDALLLMAPGLGLFQLLTSFIQLHCNGNHLVLILNTTQAQDAAIQERLTTAGVHPDNSIKIIEYDTPADTRSNLYRQSGVFSVTSRILAVDMLLERIPTAMITGIIVYNAHRVRPNSMEELILRIYRQSNKEGFIKAFSDQPEAFTTGFAPLQNTLKSLQLRKVHLWPRFQVLVSDNLAESGSDVIELRQPMTESMDKIQQALIECMQATLSEVRRANPTVDLQEFTIENSFFRSFDTIIRRQLDPIWHRVSRSTKQFVEDLKVLRQLLGYLTSYDCVSFYSFIETVIASNTFTDNRLKVQSQWLFLHEADIAISTARKRVYLKPGDAGYEAPSDTTVGGSSPVSLVLEEQPKWGLLKEVLDEIKQDMAGTTDSQGAPILIMVKEKRTCSQLKEYISRRSRAESDPSAAGHGVPVLSRLVYNYFQWRGNMNKIQGTTTGTQQEASQGTTSTTTTTTAQRGAPPNKRRRVRGGSTAASGSGRTASSTLSATQPILGQEQVAANIAILDAETSERDLSVVELGEDDILPEFAEIPQEQTVYIHCFENDQDELLLEDTAPRFIIMYDPDPAFVRRVEVYRATHPDWHIRVYFMVYDNSVEEQNYLSLLRKEKEAFEKLIREKSIMAIPLPEKERDPKDLAFARAISTRLAGGQLVDRGPPQVIVDMREFRSSLPPILYAQGIRIIPCTLQVGDYILNPDMCVERKSISDLISSFTSGRLYTQCESMSLYYKNPILLIEFDENKSFSLQNAAEMKDNIVVTDLSSKLVLLSLTFPKLRIIWSSSPHETANVFEDLKKTFDEPDAEKAALVGVDNPEDVENTYNMTPQDMLRSMPGVTSRNYKILMDAFENLQELCSSSQERLKELIGEEPSRKLYEFINKHQ